MNAIRLTYTIPHEFDGMKAEDVHATPAVVVWNTCEERLSRAVDDDQLMLICRHYYRALLPRRDDECAWHVFCVGRGVYGLRIGILDTRTRTIGRKQMQGTTLFLATNGYLMAAVELPNKLNEAVNYARHFNWQAAESA